MSRYNGEKKEAVTKKNGYRYNLLYTKTVIKPLFLKSSTYLHEVIFLHIFSQKPGPNNLMVHIKRKNANNEGDIAL